MEKQSCVLDNYSMFLLLPHNTRTFKTVFFASEQKKLVQKLQNTTKTTSSIRNVENFLFCGF